MTGLDNIAVTLEQPTGNVAPLLNEIRHALERLADSGEPTMIDLRGIPLAPGEDDALEAALGHGEVTATMNALGPSVIRETLIPGVWTVTHRNANDEIVGRYIEITKMPAILESQDADILRGIAELGERLRQVNAHGE
ncbi:MAG: hydrogenase expression/formation C-terminal domain-containing protein [Gammaproteobacteria bacterium]